MRQISRYNSQLLIHAHAVTDYRAANCATAWLLNEGLTILPYSYSSDISHCYYALSTVIT